MLIHHTGLHEVTCFHIKLAWTVQNLNMFTRNRSWNYKLPKNVIFRYSMSQT